MGKLRILLADDALTMRKFVRYGLEENFQDIEIDEVNNGREAQAKLETKNYDLILCDWEMPVISGEELLQWVRSQSASKFVPFIMLTALADKEHVMSAIKSGVTAYVVKPVLIDDLVHKIVSVSAGFKEHKKKT